MSEDSSENAIIQDLNQEMRCGIFTNAKGEVLIIHDQPLKSDIQWIEYAPKEQSFCIIHEDGHIQNLGVPFDKKIKNHLLSGQEVSLAHMVEQKIISTQTVPLIIQEV